MAHSVLWVPSPSRRNCSLSAELAQVARSKECTLWVWLPWAEQEPFSPQRCQLPQCRAARYAVIVSAFRPNSFILLKWRLDLPFVCAWSHRRCQCPISDISGSKFYYHAHWTSACIQYIYNMAKTWIKTIVSKSSGGHLVHMTKQKGTKYNN